MEIEPMAMIDNSIEAYLPLVKSIIQMENGMQPYDDETLLWKECTKHGKDIQLVLQA